MILHLPDKGGYETKTFCATLTVVEESKKTNEM